MGYKPETKQLDQIGCNANPKLSHHIFGLMKKKIVEVSPLFRFLGNSKSTDSQCQPKRFQSKIQILGNMTYHRN